MRRVLFVAQVLEAEKGWVTAEDVHRLYLSRVGKACCKRTMLRDLRLLVCMGIAEEREVRLSNLWLRAEFKFEGWPLPLGG